MKNWKDINYLKKGNPRQKEAYNCLSKLQLFEKLSTYNPILVGTIPIEIDISSSDLDIACNYDSATQFANDLNSLFSAQEKFNLKQDNQHLTATFNAFGFLIEIYGEAKPVELQNAYLHMLVEYRLLTLAKKEFKTTIIQLKENGLKTEPAFGQLLGLKEPYEELLRLSTYENDELIEILREYNWW